MLETKVSPLAPAAFPAVHTVAGVRLATAAAGIRYTGRDDLVLAELPAGTTMAGGFTRSLCTAAPVDWCRYALAAGGGRGRAIIVNSGNANAFTGAAGYRVAEHTAQSVAGTLGAPAHEVLVASTGVIGEDLPVERIDAALPALVADLSAPDPRALEAAAAAIGTTDTFPKAASAPVAGTSAHVAGIAKGSGMIAPDMATMLAFVFTDLAVDPPTAQECLAASVGKSCNRVTVDSDPSTSDTVLLAATGTSGQSATLHLAAFQDALDS
ncbi:MAG: bifunctional ornithine acetyltransferase/N-acetylglutamate synthase, partial [Acidimicrobiaceae bacterium]|nr:bifunctional ornithine acetyltransferase/N-acetylglutamate synthase [Acidimicrobiaceae bacterium]